MSWFSWEEIEMHYKSHKRAQNCYLTICRTKKKTKGRKKKSLTNAENAAAC